LAAATAPLAAATGADKAAPLFLAAAADAGAAEPGEAFAASRHLRYLTVSMQRTPRFFGVA